MEGRGPISTPRSASNQPRTRAAPLPVATVVNNASSSRQHGQRMAAFATLLEAQDHLQDSGFPGPHGADVRAPCKMRVPAGRGALDRIPEMLTWRRRWGHVVCADVY